MERKMEVGKKGSNWKMQQGNLGAEVDNINSFLPTEEILPMVKRRHLLLCTLLICNAAAMKVFFIYINFKQVIIRSIQDWVGYHLSQALLFSWTVWSKLGVLF